MTTRRALLIIAGLCLGFLGVALLLQHVKGVQSCPLCVLQRYAFAVLAIVSLLGAAFNLPRAGALAGLVATLSGLGLAGWQVWTARKPSIGCGFDPLEAMVNQWVTAKWVPSLFHAQGSCANDTFRLFGLSIPQWSLFWFALLSLALLWLLLRRGRR